MDLVKENSCINELLEETLVGYYPILKKKILCLKYQFVRKKYIEK